jgi:hypothetical protein
VPCQKCTINLTRRSSGLCTHCYHNITKPKQTLKSFLLTEAEINIILQIRNAARPPSPERANESDESENDE